MNGLEEIFNFDFPSYLSGPALPAILVGIGLIVGILTGLFGVGGGFLIVPLLVIAMGMERTLVVGSSLSFTIGTASAGAARHWRMKNLEVRTMLFLACSALVGTVAGKCSHVGLKQHLGPRLFEITFDALYLAMLLLIAWVIWRGSRRDGSGRSILQRMRPGPYIDLPGAGLSHVSLPGLLAVGLVLGIVKGLLGIGGGVLFMPLLLIVVGVGAHQAVGTSLGVVVFTSILGTVLYGLGGNVNLALVMVLLLGSAVGVQIGAWICRRLHAGRLQRYFAVIVIIAATLMAVSLVGKVI